MFRFDKALVYHCSPTLSGLKPANLLSLSKEDYPNLPELVQEYSGLLSCKGISFSILCECSCRWLLLIFRREMLQTQLSSPAVQSLLAEEGYPISSSIDVDHLLSHLKSRLTSADNFPHEIGVFLGYPLEDVLGFRRFKGEGCKLCGYWKVYSDVDSAKQCFEKFDRCRAILFSHLMAGSPLTELVVSPAKAA